MSLMIVQYQSLEELRNAHPEIKNFRMVHQAKAKETAEDELIALRKKHVDGRVYRVGNFFWKEAHYSLQNTMVTP